MGAPYLEEMWEGDRKSPLSLGQVELEVQTVVVIGRKQIRRGMISGCFYALDVPNNSRERCSTTLSGASDKPVLTGETWMTALRGEVSQ